MAILQPYIEKMKRDELTLELVLEEDEIIRDLKTNPNSQFINMLSAEAIRKLIDYSTKVPKSDDKNVGFKYPFNATEILYCYNNTVIEKMIQMILKMDKKKEKKIIKKKKTKNSLMLKRMKIKTKNLKLFMNKKNLKKNEEKPQEEPIQKEPTEEEART